MKDFKGNELAEGDRVITYHNEYANFIRGTIVKITAKQVRIQIDDNCRTYKSFGETTMRHPLCVIKDS